EKCKAKYQIADEKLAGRTLRMACRRCGHEIVIRKEEMLEDGLTTARAPSSWPGSGPHARRIPTGRPSFRPEGSSPALGVELRRQPSGAPEVGPPPFALDQGHVAINEVPVGPVRRDELGRKIGVGAVGPDSLVWREGFDDWRPLRLVPELIPLLRHR